MNVEAVLKNIEAAIRCVDAAGDWAEMDYMASTVKAKCREAQGYLESTRLYLQIETESPDIGKPIEKAVQ